MSSLYALSRSPLIQSTWRLNTILVSTDNWKNSSQKKSYQNNENKCLKYISINGYIMRVLTVLSFCLLIQRSSLMPIVHFGNTDIPYTLTSQPNKKNISIIVEWKKGVQVIAPDTIAKEQIQKIVSKKAPWILQKQREISEINPSPPSKEFVSGEKLPYLGKQYRLKVIRDPKYQQTEFVFKQGKFHAKIPFDLTLAEQTAKLRALFLDWCSQHAEIKFRERLNLYAERLGLSYRSFSFKARKTKWGSCTSQGDIVIHPNLVFAPITIIDYVLIHELAHLKHFNHSKEFWNYLGFILPDYKKRKEWLRLNGPSLTI
jgi:predicted metal-dependent hydrolase